MKIGIFGGSFNPPHKMHKDIACNLIKNNYVNKVIYVPTGNKYKKNGLIDVKHRYNMLKIMIKNNKNLEVSDYEINDLLTYTYQTLDYFKNKYKEDDIYFICGLDNLKEFNTWKNYKYILNEYNVIVIPRGSDDISEVLKKINSENIIVANISLNGISSSYIRNALAIKQSDDLLNVLDSDVLKYIENQKLYIKNNIYKRNN